jgi:hypothetical protein
MEELDVVVALLLTARYIGVRHWKPIVIIDAGKLSKLPRIGWVSTDGTKALRSIFELVDGLIVLD